LCCSANRQLYVGSFKHIDIAIAVKAAVDAELNAFQIILETKELAQALLDDGVEASREEIRKLKLDFLDSIDVKAIGFDVRLQMSYDALVELKKTNRSMIVPSDHELSDIIRDINNYYSLHLDRQESPLDRYDNLELLITMGFCFHPEQVGQVSSKPVSSKKRLLSGSVINACRAVRSRVCNAEESVEYSSSEPLPPIPGGEMMEWNPTPASPIPEIAAV
jgi:hypothetical protein